MKSPFPGMDPYLEYHWGDIHASLIVSVRDALNQRLPRDLVARRQPGRMNCSGPSANGKLVWWGAERGQYALTGTCAIIFKRWRFSGYGLLLGWHIG